MVKLSCQWPGGVPLQLISLPSKECYQFVATNIRLQGVSYGVKAAAMMEPSTSRKRRVRRLPAILRALSSSHPRTAAHLSQAQLNRERHLSEYFDGARLRGYEELIDHLEALEGVFQMSRRLRGISRLIRRVRGDFQLALGATLSGFHSVAHDAMRDVMEVEFLLREFHHDPHQIEEWLHATSRKLYKEFRPAILRQRHAKRLGMQLEDVGEATDYQAHSRMLHVSPHPHPFGGTGFSGPEGPFDTDVCFWEMFEHGRRVLFEAHFLRRKLARHIKVRGAQDVALGASVMPGNGPRRCKRSGWL